MALAGRILRNVSADNFNYMQCQLENASTRTCDIELNVGIFGVQRDIISLAICFDISHRAYLVLICKFSVDSKQNR